jgi:hypothetical protein
MHKLLLLFVAVSVMTISGCGNGLSSDFSKSGKFAFTLVSKAAKHESVLERDVNTAFAHAEADAKSDTDKKTYEMLHRYLNQFLSNDNSPEAEKTVAICNHALSRIFDENVRPEEAAKECDDAQSAWTDRIVKEVTASTEKEKAEKEKAHKGNK